LATIYSESYVDFVVKILLRYFNCISRNRTTVLFTVFYSQRRRQ